MIQEYVLKKAFDLALAKIGESLKNTDTKVETSSDDLEAALNYHLREVRTWASEMSFADLRTAKRTSEGYLPLTVYLQPRRLRMAEDEEPHSLPIGRLFDNPDTRHIVILGHPGAGKTTSMKHLCQRLLLEEEFLADRFNVPILLRLRDLNLKSEKADGNSNANEVSVLRKLQELLGLRIVFPPDLMTEDNSGHRRLLRERMVIEILDSLKALVILDGFDELAHKTYKVAVLRDIRTLTAKLEHASLLVTSRTGEFNAHIENAVQFEISPLNPRQVARFAQLYLGEGKARHMLSQFTQSPFADTAVRPLTIAHLCAIYERTGSIPEKPKTVYRKVVNLLLHEWDEQKSVKRESAYAEFEIDRKAEFLAHLAYVLTTQAKRSVFSSSDILRAYGKIFTNFGLPKGDAENVAREIESHTGLLLQAGYELYEFSHKSLQEYLAAEHLVRLPSIPDDARLLTSIPNELAVATAISSSPSEYLTELVCNRFLKYSTLTFEFVTAFVSRLLVEKPDFDKSTKVGVALVGLYSLYVGRMIEYSSQQELFVVDRAAREFESLAALLKGRIRVTNLLDVFDQHDKSDGVGGVAVLRLQKKPKHSHTWTKSDPRSVMVANLPSELWVRASLVEGLIE
ncbi:MAG: NACHT domain-containing protein [Rhodocyclaceae bacterium]|nr:NACHT domain-containing protein [Rhodocyclaceae bacterium]